MGPISPGLDPSLSGSPPWGLPQNDEGSTLLQVPATVGFLQPDFRLCQRLLKITENPIAKKFRPKGMLNRIGLLNQVWLSPELSDADSMIRLARRMQINNQPCLNMTFHSTSLRAGMSPFARTKEGEHQILQKIREVLVFARDAGFEFMSLAQYAADFDALTPSCGAVEGSVGEAVITRQANQMKTLLQGQAGDVLC